MQTHEQYVAIIDAAETYEQAVKAYTERKKELKELYRAAQSLQKEGRLKGSAWADFMESYQMLKKAHAATWDVIQVHWSRGVQSSAAMPHKEAVEVLKAAGLLS